MAMFFFTFVLVVLPVFHQMFPPSGLHLIHSPPHWPMFLYSIVRQLRQRDSLSKRAILGEAEPTCTIWPMFRRPRRPCRKVLGLLKDQCSIRMTLLFESKEGVESVIKLSTLILSNTYMIKLCVCIFQHKPTKVTKDVLSSSPLNSILRSINRGVRSLGPQRIYQRNRFCCRFWEEHDTETKNKKKHVIHLGKYRWKSTEITCLLWAVIFLGGITSWKTREGRRGEESVVILF